MFYLNKSNQDPLIWLFRKKNIKNILTEAEKLQIKDLSISKAKQFAFSRSSIRKELSLLFETKPLDVPLNAPPQKAPKLTDKYGYLSISHCKDAFIFCWSSDRIGIDIERRDRKINHINFNNRIFNKNENKELIKNKNFYKQEFIKRWVVKESLIKYHKQSLFKNSKDWSWLNNDFYAFNNKDY